MYQRKSIHIYHIKEKKCIHLTFHWLPCSVWFPIRNKFLVKCQSDCRYIIIEYIIRTLYVYTCICVVYEHVCLSVCVCMSVYVMYVRDFYICLMFIFCDIISRHCCHFSCLAMIFNSKFPQTFARCRSLWILRLKYISICVHLL